MFSDVNINSVVGVAESYCVVIARTIEQSSLNYDECMAVVIYTVDLREEIRRGQQNFFKSLNNALKANESETISRLLPYLSYLTNGLTKLPRHEGIVFRGLPLAELQEVAAENKQDMRVVWRGVTSTTPSLEKAQEFANQGGIIFRIRSHTGRLLGDYSCFPDEAEVTFLPESEFLVTEALRVVDGFYYLDLSEIRGTYVR